MKARPTLSETTHGRSGATERVVAGLRHAIVTMEFAPGAPLDKQVLTETYGVSRFPVAAALKRLEAEGLVEVRPQSGSRVSLIRLSDMHENLFLRRALEAEVVQHVAELGDASLLTALKRNLRYQETAVEVQDRDGFHELDIVFHDLIVNRLGYPRIAGVIESARLALDRVRRMLNSPRRLVFTYEEHVAIVAAIEAGNGPAAHRAMVAHINAVLAELEEFSCAHPEAFSDGKRATAFPSPA